MYRHLARAQKNEALQVLTDMCVWCLAFGGELPDGDGRGALRGRRRITVNDITVNGNDRRGWFGHSADLPVGPAGHQRLVLGLGPPQGRLHRHHPLALAGKAALFALARAVLAVPLVALEGDLEPVVAAPGAIRRRPRAQRRAGRVQVHFNIERFL